jgi:hypothetical protein
LAALKRTKDRSPYKVPAEDEEQDHGLMGSARQYVDDGKEKAMSVEPRRVHKKENAPVLEENKEGR